MRTDWMSLPAAVRDTVESRTGPVVSTATIEEGLNCSLALSLRTAEGDALFVKGVRKDDREGRKAQVWEVTANPWVAGIGPSLRWHVEAEGWFLLAFDYIDGRHAELGPDSDDYECVADLLQRMQGLPLPDTWVPSLSERFASFLPPWKAELLKGEHLLHTDINPHNVLITDGGRAHLVDWAMPAVGPVWVDAAYTAVRLMEGGTPPVTARRWLDRFRSWRQADAEAVRAFVEGTCRHWEHVAGNKAARHSNARFRALAE
ncbi:phosphotransferase [Streptomyces sp. SAJ15]|uniref:phosphotransferase n=1 Tax=Streptomyces sp. SAJ15 TaxID=2011095 RepID=UPI0021B1DB99|nr:phosphotransferase [Streptomyces sp. SAJ15]